MCFSLMASASANLSKSRIDAAPINIDDRFKIAATKPATLRYYRVQRSTTDGDESRDNREISRSIFLTPTHVASSSSSNSSRCASRKTQRSRKQRFEQQRKYGDKFEQYAQIVSPPEGKVSRRRRVYNKRAERKSERDLQ